MPKRRAVPELHGDTIQKAVLYSEEFHGEFAATLTVSRHFHFRMCFHIFNPLKPRGKYDLLHHTKTLRSSHSVFVFHTVPTINSDGFPRYEIFLFTRNKKRHIEESGYYNPLLTD
jgi:hypothetical protein